MTISVPIHDWKSLVDNAGLRDRIEKSGYGAIPDDYELVGDYHHSKSTNGVVHYAKVEKMQDDQVVVEHVYSASFYHHLDDGWVCNGVIYTSECVDV